MNIFIPRFCYHKKLSVAANCRMCLVEVEKVGKPLPACATLVTEGMRVWTQSKKALDAQRAVMEFLLINHPLDCPICDQGGACELQDFSMAYGASHSHYAESKRAVADQDIGPLIQTNMTRCIQCTRCVRFGTEITGQRELGALGRGEHLEIGTFVSQSLQSELSGNVIDLCPVGALTSKPFQFKARAWEMRSHPGIAPHDGFGSHIAMQTRANQVLKVVPKEAEAVNEVWLSDRDRFSYEALHHPKRLKQAFCIEGGAWKGLSFESALKQAATLMLSTINHHGPDAMAGLIHPSSTTEEMHLFQNLFRRLGIGNIDHRLWLQDESWCHTAGPAPGLGGSLATLEQEPCVVLIGSELRHELPLLSVRLRRQAANGGRIVVLNPIDYEFNFEAEANFVVQGHDFSAALQKLKLLFEKQPLIAHNGTHAGRILVGDLLLSHPAAANIVKQIEALASYFNLKVGYMHRGSNAMGAYQTNCLPNSSGFNRSKPLKLLVLFGVDPKLDLVAHPGLKGRLDQHTQIIAFSSFDLDSLRDSAHVLLPIHLFAETPGTYINLEGKIQSFCAAVSPVESASQPGWEALKALMEQLQLKTGPYSGWEAVHRTVIGSLVEAKTEFRSEEENEVQNKCWKSADPSLLTVIRGFGLYQADAIVRHAKALNQSPLADRNWMAVHPLTFESSESQIPEALKHWVKLDPAVPEGTVWIPSGFSATAKIQPYERLGWSELFQLVQGAEA